MKIRLALTASLLLVGLFSTAVPAAAAGSPAYSGRAYAVGIIGASLRGTAIPDNFIIDSGELPSAGGSKSAGVGTQTLPGLGSVDVLLERADGAALKASAESKIASAALIPQAGKADLVDVSVASAKASVSDAGNGVLTSDIASLSINGTSIVPSPGTNVEIVVPGPSPNSVVAKIILNQQAYDPLTNRAEANAAVITFPANGVLAAIFTGTIQISHAVAGLGLPLDITKTVNGQPVATVKAGDQVSYTITITNSAQGVCSLESVTDNLPPAPSEGGVPFTYVSGGPAGASAKTSTTNGRNSVTWTFATGPTLAKGATLQFTFVAQVPSNEPAGKYTDEATYVATCGTGTTGNTAAVTVATGGVLGATTGPSAATPFTSALAQAAPIGQLAAMILGLLAVLITARLRRLLQ